jgi:cytochrome P450
MEILNVRLTATLGAVQRLMVKLDHCVEKREHGVTIDIAEELRHLTLQVISETFMSLEAEESDTIFATMYLPIVEEGNKRVWSPDRSYNMFFSTSFWKYIFGVRRLNHCVSNRILKRWDLRIQERKEEAMIRSNARNTDILDKVLDHFEKENPGKRLSSSDVRQLCDEFKTFMLAGHETSAAMMTWAFYELMKDDFLMDKVCLCNNFEVNDKMNLCYHFAL